MRRPNYAGRGASKELVNQALIDRCKTGDQAAWKDLVAVTHREVYTLCLRILGDPDDAAEATQDAYVKVWKGLGGFRGDAMFTTWLYRVAANAAISKQRSRRRRRSHEVSDEQGRAGQIAAPNSTEGAASARLELAEVERALATLPELYRVAVVLRDVYGLSIDEIARQTKVSETAAKVRVHRGRKMLRDLVMPPGEGEQDEV